MNNAQFYALCKQMEKDREVLLHERLSLRNADRAVQRMCILQTLTDDELIAYVEGQDEICIRVAKETYK